MVVHFVVCVFGTIVKDDEFRGSMEAGGSLCERPGKFIGRKNPDRDGIEDRARHSLSHHLGTGIYHRLQLGHCRGDSARTEWFVGLVM